MICKNYVNFLGWPGGGFSSGHKWGILGGHRGPGISKRIVSEIYMAIDINNRFFTLSDITNRNLPAGGFSKTSDDL